MAIQSAAILMERVMPTRYFSTAEALTLIPITAAISTTGTGIEAITTVIGVKNSIDQTMRLLL